MNLVMRIIKEPLVHFLLAGSGLFFLYSEINGNEIDDPNQIVITQNQVKLLATNFVRVWKRSPTEEEVKLLVDDYLRDEVYYREALALGLDEDDTVIRRRLRQKLGFILEDTAALLNPSDEELTAYMLMHVDKFRIQPQMSFSQVYLSTDKRSDIDTDVETILVRLRAGEDPQQLGDRIMLDDTYTLVSQDYVKRNFGDGFSHQLLSISPGSWEGPLTSGFGVHLVLITELKPSYIPELAEVKEEVKSEWLLTRTEEVKQDIFHKLLENYEVVMQEPIKLVDVTSSDLSSLSKTVSATQPGKETR